jgi:hypothetical protein
VPKIVKSQISIPRILQARVKAALMASVEQANISALTRGIDLMMASASGGSSQ